MGSAVSNFIDMEWDQVANVLRVAIRGFLREGEVQRYLGETNGNGRPQNEECLYPAIKKHLENSLVRWGRARAASDDARPLFRSAIVSERDEGEATIAPYVVDANCGTTHAGSKMISVPHDNLQGCIVRRARPNCIVHVPGTNKHNLIVIEMRKSDQQLTDEVIEERRKMVGYTRPSLNYRFALYLCLGVAGVASNQIYALLKDREEVQGDWQQHERQLALAGRFNRCLRRLNGSSDNLREVEIEMAEIQCEMGFRNVTDELVSGRIRKIPSERIRFPVAR
jgi:hypothetical protein